MMKKLFLISLLLGMVFRANADHWVPNENLYPNTMSVIAVIKINGEEQLRTDLELGAFCGDEVRGSQRPTDEYYEVLPHYFLFLTTYGNDGDALTFRLYDHTLDQELVATCLSDTIFTTNETLGNPGSPFVIEFVVETPSTYTITAVASPSEGGSVSGMGTFNNGATCTLTATPANGYDFVNWTEDSLEVSTNATYTFTVAGDRDLVAHFEESDIPGSGSGTEDDPYDVTAAIALQDVPTSPVWVQGYIVGLVTSANNVNWTGPFNSNSNVAIANSSDCTDTDQCLYVQLPNNTALRTQVNLQDHPENLGRLLSVRGTLTPYFTPHAGLKNSPGTVNDFHLEAPETYTITVTANPAAGGIVTGAGEYVEGDSCTLVATPNDGYQFDNWTKGNTIVSNNATYAFSVTESGDYVANFSETSGGEYHWTVNINQYPNTMSVIAVIKINGVEQMSTNYEVGAFCGTECRGRELPTDEYYIPEVMPHYFVFLTTYGNDNDQFTFRLYDHNLSQEVIATCVTNATFVTNGTLGDPGNPFVIEFVTSSTHTITVSADPEEGGTVSGGGEYDHGAECTLTAVANTGYTFINWTLNDQVVSTDAEYTFEVTGDAAYVAHFTLLQTYTITALANPAAGGTVTGAGNYLEGTECTLNAVANTGYTFNNWTLNEVVIDSLPTLTFTVTEAATYVANFTIENYNVTVTANPGEGGTVTGGGTYNYGTECTVTALANDGYVFSNWTINGMIVSSEAEYTFNVEDNTALVANFDEDVEDEYYWNVDIYEFPNTMSTIAIIQIDGIEQLNLDLEVGAFCGEQCRGRERPIDDYYIPEVMPHYFVFLTTYGNDGDVFTFKLYDHATNQVLDLDCVASVTFVTNGSIGDPGDPFILNFTNGIQYEITTSANPEEGGVVSGAGSYDANAECTLTATANEGYTFANWTMNDSIVSTEAEYTFTVTENADFVAYFTLNSYEITAVADPDAGGTVTGAGIMNHFAQCTLTAAANTGYTFVNWTKNGTEVTTDTSFTFIVTETAEYVAHFVINTYPITANAEPSVGGSVTGAGIYEHFSNCTLTASPATGYHFINWTMNDEEVGTDTILNFVVEGPVAYVAHFAINSYEISAVANPTAGGVVTGAGTYDHFSTCTLTAEANEGYTFINWTLNNEVVGNNSTISFTVAGTAEYVANFELNSYEITASVEPANTGTVSGAGTYDHFSTCTLTATAATGYHFVNWTLGGEEVGTEPELVFEVSGPASYVAHFAINNYAITVAAHPTNGGTVTGGGNFDHGTTVTLTAVSADQFIFVNWTKDNEEVSVDSIYVFTATEEGLYVANFERVMVTQHTEIHDGWNWYSTYIEQDELNQQEFNGLNMLEESLGTIGKKIVSQTTSTTYYANFGWMGRLHEITNEDSYRIQATATVETSVTGPVVHPEEHPITLKQGWNWIGYPCTESMSLSTALSGLTPSNRDQVKTADKSAMYYANFGWMGRLQTIEPGMGLLYQSNNEADVVFTYPNASGNASKAEESIDLHWVANHYAYPDNMTIMAIVELDDEELISEQYEVAAFANGECRGSAPLMYVEPLDRYVAFLVLSGDEVTTLNFGLYNAASDTECFDSDTYVIYSSNAILGDPMEPFAIHFRSHTGINEFSNRLTVFPNPVERGGIISLGANYDESEVRVEIINVLGTVVYSKTASRMPECIAAPQVSGVYTLRITAKGEDTCYRKLIVR